MSVRQINFTFTISHPDLGDVVIPISSCTCRVREGSPSYLQVVVPNYFIYIDDILDRATHCRSCELVINKIKDRDTDTPIEVLRVEFENLRLDRGSKSQSIFLVGHRMFYNPTPKTVVLTDVDYLRTGIDIETGSTHRLRCSAYLNITAGDIVTYTIDGYDYTLLIDLLTFNATQYDFEQEASGTGEVVASG